MFEIRSGFCPQAILSILVSKYRKGCCAAVVSSVGFEAMASPTAELNEVIRSFFILNNELQVPII
jgi:hypothetical protein